MIGGFLEDVSLLGNDGEGDIVLVSSIGHFDLESPEDELSMAEKANGLLIEQYKKEYMNG